MTRIEGTVAAGQGAPAEQARLRRAAQQMEGLFVEQMFKAMRESVPEGGIADGGPGEEMFSGLLDSHLANQVPTSWDHGLGAAIYRQMQAAAKRAEGQP